jgi:hypothetical protein
VYTAVSCEITLSFKYTSVPVVTGGSNDTYKGGAPGRVIWVTRITVTLSILKFSTWFFTQIVENRETRLSRPCLGPGDIFSKSYDENRFVWQLYGTSDLRIRPARAQAHFDQFWFSSQLFKKLSPGLKNSLERRPLRFSTICTKNQVLKLKIDKVTVILRRK